MSFADLGVDARLLTVLDRLGYQEPSQIQKAAIGPLLNGHDVIGRAQTGTGKTAAFALPILGRIDTSVPSPQALILAPTRELAIQVADACSTYAEGMDGLRVLPIYGGQSYGIQLSGLDRGAHIVVGTPGRIIDHLRRGSLDISKISHLVLDEADEMLDMGFTEDVETILEATGEAKQIALFSATMPPGIRSIAKRFLHEPVDVHVEATSMTAENTRQRWLPVNNHHKLDSLARILEVEDANAMIVFVRTKQSAEDLSAQLVQRGFAAEAINGDIVQAQRERTIGRLRSGGIDVLVATDVAARGLDVERISHVINYDIPRDAESYVHRIGRTGRAGRSGEAIVFVAPRDKRQLAMIKKATGSKIEQMALPTVDDVNALRLSRFAEQITTSLGSSRFHFYRGLVTDYVKDHDVEVLDVAAALAAMPSAPAMLEAADTATIESRPVASSRPSSAASSSVAPSSAEARSARSHAGPRQPYRISVGRRNGIKPGMIVGALTNEGGLSRADFGKIWVNDNHSIVELPPELPKQAWHGLRHTKIAGRPIRLQADTKPRAKPATPRKKARHKS